MSESAGTGSRSARPLAFASVRVSMDSRLAKSCVVIHRDAVADGHGLASEHVAISDFFVGQTVARRHFDLALGYFRAARRTHAGLARERRGKARSARAVEDIALGERHAPGTPVEGHGDGHAFRPGLKLGDLARDRFGRTIGGKALNVDALPGDVAV